MLQGRQLKKNSFRPKMAKKCQFLAESSVLLDGVVGCRAPYPIFRVSDPLKRGLNRIGAMSRVFQGLQHQKTSLFAPNYQKMSLKHCFFRPKKTLKREYFRLFCLFSGPNPVF